MAKLTGETVASTYSLLLKVKDTTIHATDQQLIEDGDANPSALKLSAAGITSTGALAVDGISTLTGAVTATAGVTGALDGIVGGTTPAAVTGTTIDGVIGSVTPAAITGTTITGTTIGGTVITASTNFAGDITGDLTGTASLVAVADSSAATAFPVVFNDESDALLDDTGAFTYKPSTGTLIATAVTSDLTGNVIGDVKATNGTSTILDSGTDGTDATLAAGVTLADGVTATTQDAGTNDTTVATTAYADAASGTVLQVVYADLDTDTFTSADSAMTQITGLTASITPASADNYILIQVMISYGTQYQGTSAFGLQRDTTQIGSAETADDDRRDALTAGKANIYHGGIVDTELYNGYIQYRDAPASTSAIDYTATVSISASKSFTLNRPYDDADSVGVVHGRSSITLTEIKG